MTGNPVTVGWLISTLGAYLESGKVSEGAVVSIARLRTLTEGEFEELSEEARESCSFFEGKPCGFEVEEIEGIVRNSGTGLLMVCENSLCQMGIEDALKRMTSASCEKETDDEDRV